MVVMDTKHKIQRLKAIFEPGKTPNSYDFSLDRKNHGTGDTKAKQLRVLDKRAQDSQITTDPAKSSKFISFGDLKNKLKFQKNSQQQVKLVRKGGVRHKSREGSDALTGDETSVFGAVTLPGNVTTYFTEEGISSPSSTPPLLKSKSTGELNVIQEQNRTPVKSLSQNPLRSFENETVYAVPLSQPVKKESETEVKSEYVNTKRLFNKGYRRADATENRTQQVGTSSAIPPQYKTAVQREKETRLNHRLSRSLPDLAFQEPELRITNVKGLFQNLNRSPPKPAVPTKSPKPSTEAEDSSTKIFTFDSKDTSKDSSSSSTLPSKPVVYDDVPVSNFSKLRSKFEQNEVTSSGPNYQKPKLNLNSDGDKVKSNNEYQVPDTSGKPGIGHEYSQPSFPNEYEVPDSSSSRPSSSELDDSLNTSFREEKLKKLFGVRDLEKDLLDEENNVRLPKKFLKKKISDKKKGKSAKTIGSDGPLYAVSSLDTKNTSTHLGGKNIQTSVPPSTSMNARTENSSSSADSGHSNTFSEVSVSPQGSARKPSSGDHRDQFRDSDFIDGDIEIEEPGPRVSDSDFESEEESSKVKAPKPPTFNSNSHKVAYELLTSERTYVDRLYLLSEVFQKRITAENEKHKWFSADVVKDIFSNIGTIYNFHHQFFLPELEMRLLEWDRKPCIGDILKKISHYLKMYAVYVSNFDTAMSQLNTWKAKVPKFANALSNVVQNEKRCNNLALEHHMLEPVQRIPRYELLLKEYLKKLPGDSQDKDDALKALEVISQAAEHSNKRIKVTEEIDNLFKLNARIDGMDIIDPSRRLLKEGKLDKLTTKNDLQDRYIFLFNDILLCCDKKKAKIGSKTYKIKEKLYIDGMQVFDSINQRFKIEAAGSDLEFQAASEEDKEDWMKVFLGAVKELIRKKDTFKNNPELFDISYEDQLGKQPPKFIKDEETTMCMLCGTDFERLLKRRHHCRACGAVVCGQCCRHEIQLPYDNNKSNKVCSRCYHKLSKQPNVEDLTRRSFVPNLDEVPHFATSLHLLQKNTWNKYWVAVTQQDLFALKAPRDVRAVLTLPVKLYEVKEVSAKDGVGDREFVFKLEHGQTSYFFSAESIRIKSNWMEVLRDGIKGEPKQIGITTL
ncbi:FYVE, RhoGEF and PH domain-containing protein 4 [Holothuria leucospilota]|uniref:FYVE, RhoGEF and PH domain-containing protein 4 n=1 Tax=Holothuria leucospilota TaxID=206669 RepID=A0A9Q1HJ60_HOLLE|nr:FYVE, RhoGEF and PH domain-containing protein 4 [Holothuria leucospilota]